MAQLKVEAITLCFLTFRSINAVLLTRLQLLICSNQFAIKFVLDQDRNKKSELFTIPFILLYLLFYCTFRCTTSYHRLHLLRLVL